MVPPQGAAGLLPALAARQVPAGPVHYRLCALCRSQAFGPQGSAVSGAPVSCPQQRVQPGAWAAGAWGPRWGACVGVLSRPHLLLGSLFWPHTSRGGQTGPHSKYCWEKLVPTGQGQAGACRKLGPPPEAFLPPGEKGEEEDEGEEEMLSDASPWTYSSSPDDSEPDAPRPPPSPVTHALKEGETPSAPAAAPSPVGPPPPVSSLCSGAPLPMGGGAQPALSGTPQVAQQTEALASPGSLSPSALALALEEDAQIGPRRVRKAARRELLPCDFPGCGRIFSNRQYLNHHKKYQHIHQKSFSCPEPACGKSFNFKKHLKEHVKLHSDTRDYICEFCARPFRTGSNLLIHRRIHTGEKPLQCEICGFTCRQKASLNWHRRKHVETAAALRFPCEVCGKRFEKPDSVAAHCSKSHPALFLESPRPLEPCPSICASVPLGSGDGCRPSGVPQTLTLLPQQ
ncbi:zinc finger protein 692 isoform 16-T30 [Hipposideros larvatus]